MDIQIDQSYFSNENLNFIENFLLTNLDILNSREKYSKLNSKLMYLICKLFVKVRVLCYQLVFQNKGK